MKKFKKQKSRLLDFRKLLDPPETMLNPHLEEVFEFLNYKNKEHPSFSRKTIQAPGSLTLAHSQNSQMSFMYGFFFVKFLFFTVVCVVIVI